MSRDLIKVLKMRQYLEIGTRQKHCYNEGLRARNAESCVTIHKTWLSIMTEVVTTLWEMTLIAALCVVEETAATMTDRFATSTDRPEGSSDQRRVGQTGCALHIPALHTRLC